MAQITLAKDAIGAGIYTMAEAAAYARMPVATLSRWLGTKPDQEKVLRPEIPIGSDKLVTFIDFFQALAVRNIRQHTKVSLQKIREAVNRAAEVYKIDYPLARRHLTYVYGKELFIAPPGAEDDAEKHIIQISGKGKNQLPIVPIVEIYMKDVTTWNNEGLPDEYKAFSWSGHDILMNPRKRFGEPVVVSCGYTALALVEACETEGSIDNAAEAYGVTKDEVEAAYRYFDYLDKVA